MSTDAAIHPQMITAGSAGPPRLMVRVKEALRSRHYSRRTEDAYRNWIKRYIYYHQVRHPVEMGEPEINAFLSHLALEGKVSSSTQNQALAALLFLYRYVINREIGDLGQVVRARKPERLPVVMTRAVRKAHLTRRVTGQTFRHSFATHLQEDGYLSAVQVAPAQAGDIRTIQELLGHKDVKTTMIYTHVLNRGGAGVKSPMDNL